MFGNRLTTIKGIELARDEEEKETVKINTYLSLGLKTEEEVSVRNS